VLEPETQRRERGDTGGAAPTEGISLVENSAPNRIPGALEVPADLPAHVLRSRAIDLEFSELPTPATLAGEEMPLFLFAETPHTVRWQELAVHAPDNFAWHGSLAEDPASGVTLTRYKDHAIIDVQSPLFGQYELRSQDGHPGELREFDSARINRGCPGGVLTAGFGGTPVPESESESDETVGGPAYAVAKHTIDVMMVYTAKTREKSGSRSAVVTKAQAAVNNQNGVLRQLLRHGGWRLAS
jgi:hypothetical protein